MFACLWNWVEDVARSSLWLNESGCNTGLNCTARQRRSVEGTTRDGMIVNHTDRRTKEKGKETGSTYHHHSAPPAVHETPTSRHALQGTHPSIQIQLTRNAREEDAKPSISSQGGRARSGVLCFEPAVYGDATGM